MTGIGADGDSDGGVVALRSLEADDVPCLVAGHDRESQRWLGPGDEAPRPFACIVVGGELVGWIDFDTDRSWLQPGEVNVGYSVFAAHRGRGHATRALELLLERLARDTDFHTATLLIDAANERSLAVARRAGFTFLGLLDGNPYFARRVTRSPGRAQPPE